MALFNETDKIHKLPDTFRKIVRLISQFESICQFDAFDYKTPTDEQLCMMITGLSAIKEFVKVETSLVKELF